MDRRLLSIVAAAVLVLVGWMAWTRHKEEADMSDGAVSFAADTGSGNGGRNSGESDSGSDQAPDGHGRASRTVRVSGDARPSEAASASGSMSDTLRAETEAASPLPSVHTLAPEPPEGAAFGGSGKYQWYRQGNLTWRLNTENGASCIAFATLNEWRKPVVYAHGCGRG